MLRRPQLRILHADDRLAVRKAADAPPRKVQVARAVIVRLHLDPHAGIRRVRRDAKTRDISLRHPLRPDRLPQAALRRIPDAAAFCFLLAARECIRVRAVTHRDQQFVFLCQRVGHVHGERRIAAHVRAHAPFVEIDRTLLIRRAEMQQQTRSLARLLRKRAPVPERLPRKQRPPDAGKRSLRRKRHQDLSVPALRRSRRVRDGVVPEAVQVPVAPAHHLRARIFLQNGVRVERFAPDRFHTRSSPAAIRRLSASTNGTLSASSAAAARKIAGVGMVFVTPSST